MTIVVPTDFSACAQMAVHYAAAFAQQTQSRLLLLHVLPDFGPSMGTLSTDELKEEAIESATKELESIKEAISATGVNVSYNLAFGAAVDTVLEHFLKEHGIDLIIIGSHGASGLKKALLGSNTVDVVNHATVPVIVVPEHTVIETITHILYASNLKKIHEETELLLPFARLLKASVKIIHVPPPQYFDQLDCHPILASLKKETGYSNIEIELLKGGDVQDAIEQYAVATHGDLLAMFTHRTSFLEQLFSKSLTREIIWQSRTPLLVVNKQND